MDSKCNAVILYLSRKQDINDLTKSIKLLHKFFNKKFNYPIVIFHDDFSEKDKELFLKKYSIINFEFINFEVPEWIDRNKISHKSLGYKHMCRFFSGEIYKHSALKTYDWYWRLDSDSFLHSHINYDVFKFMEKNKYIYGYLGEVLKDYPWSTLGLWDLTKKYIDNNKIKPTYLHEYLDNEGNYDLSLYYTNFEISNLDFWRSDKYMRYYNTIDQSGGIYYYRWGDHVIHFLGLSSLVAKNKIYCFKDIDYSHQSFRPNNKSLTYLIFKTIKNSTLFGKILEFVYRMKFLKYLLNRKFIR